MCHKSHVRIFSKKIKITIFSISLVIIHFVPGENKLINTIGIYLTIIFLLLIFIDLLFTFTFFIDMYNFVKKVPKKWGANVPILKWTKNKLIRTQRINYIKYDLPLLVFLFSFWPIALTTFFLTDIFDNYSNWFFISIYLLVTIMYLLLMYADMFVQDRQKYLYRLKHHRECLKLIFIPLSFVFTLTGLISFFSDINIDTAFVINILRNLFSFSFDSPNLLLSAGNIIGVTILMSLPAVLIGYFLNQLLFYLYYHGKHYKRFFIGVKLILRKILNL